MSFMEIKRFVNSGNTPLNTLIGTEIKNKINSDEDKALDVIIRELCKKPFYFTGFKDVVNKPHSVSTLPYNFYNGSAVVYNNEFHILGGGNTTAHYKWDGSSWVKVSTLPYNFLQGSAVVYNNEIHILGSNSSSYYTSHCNGTTICLKSGILQQGMCIYIHDVPSESILPITNCEKQSDGALLVNSDGLVEFKVFDYDSSCYSIF